MSRWLLAAALSFWSVLSLADDAVTIQKTIPYADGAGTDALKTECDWNTELSSHIVDRAKGAVVASEQSLDQVAGKTLTMSIARIHVAGGGNYSGPKWAALQGELREGGQVIGSFLTARHSSGPFNFTACSVADRIGKALAKDVVLWLKNPSMNTRLGDSD